MKSSIHRVVLPPKDQRDIYRSGVIYFSRPGKFTALKAIQFAYQMADDDVVLKPVKSPLIDESMAKAPANGMTAGSWMVARYKGVDYSEKPKGNVINGIVVDGYA